MFVPTARIPECPAKILLSRRSVAPKCRQCSRSMPASRLGSPVHIFLMERLLYSLGPQHANIPDLLQWFRILCKEFP